MEVKEWRIVSEELWAANEAPPAQRRNKFDGQQIGGLIRTDASRLKILSRHSYVVCAGTR
jgi:hypothetical protein